MGGAVSDAARGAVGDSALCATVAPCAPTRQAEQGGVGVEWMRRRGAREGSLRGRLSTHEGIGLNDGFLVIRGEDNLAKHCAVLTDALGEGTSVQAAQARDIV